MREKKAYSTPSFSPLEFLIPTKLSSINCFSKAVWNFSCQKGVLKGFFAALQTLFTD